MSSEEGYCTDSDDNKIVATEIIPEVNAQPPTIENIERVENKINLENNNNDIHINGNKVDNTQDSLPNDIYKEDDKFCEDASSLNNFRNRRTTKERLKRRKMEELKGMYKDYATSRGSSDLYKTLLDSYADFDHDEDFGSNLAKSPIPEGVETAVSAKTKKKYSVCEKEALMRRDLVLTELADTEKSYVEDLGVVINVSSIAFLQSTSQGFLCS